MARLDGGDDRRGWDDPAFADALALHREVGLVDMHVDSIIQQRLFRYDMRAEHRPGVQGQPWFWHADVPRMLQGGYGGACMGIHYWPFEREAGWRECTRQIDYLDRVAREDGRCLRVRRPEDWALARDQGLLGLAPGVEGAHMLAGRLDRVEALGRRQVAYLTLCHFSRNSAATPSMGRGADEESGLTAFGRQLVELCNGQRIALDLAHVNTPGVLEVCRLSKKPVLCTHTGVKAVHDHARNISDEEIDAIAATGGVIGIMAGPIFLAGRVSAGSGCMVEHIEHVAARVGTEHLCVGTDYDGWLPRIPRDQRDCRDLVRVTQALLERGWGEGQLRGMLRDNVLRVLSEQ